MAERQNMAGGEGGVPTEAPQPAGEAVQTGGMTPNEVLANASLTDRERVQSAKALLGTQLTPQQEEAVLRAHYEAADEPGKDQKLAGIGNYTTGQLLRKARILKGAGFSKEQVHNLLGSGIAGLEVPGFLKEAKRTESRFEQLRKWVEEYDEKNIDMVRLTLAEIDEYKKSRYDNLLEMTDLINEAQARGVLAYVMEDIRQIYTRVGLVAPDTATRRRRRRQSMYGDSNPEPPPKGIDERIADVRSVLADYQETFWDFGDSYLRARFGTANISGMKEAYQGVSGYVASKVATAIAKELKGIPLDPAGEMGDYFLEEIKRQFAENATGSERQRQRQRRIAGPDEMLGYNNWRERFEFSWAETREELERSVFAWIEKFEKHLPNETAEIVHQEVGKWKANAIGALEVAAHDLNISEKEPFYERLRSTIETYTNVLGGIKLLESDGGFEPYTSYLEAHAHNFNAHHDAIYLGNARSAIVQHFLSRAFRDPLNREYRGGAISLGAPTTIEKPQAGDLEDFRGSIEEQAKKYAATHELYIRKDDFDRREVESNDGYGWDDVIDELLLDDSRGMAKAKAISADPNNPDRQIAEARIKKRTSVFKNIKKRLDEEDKLAGLTEDQRREVIRGRITNKIRLAGDKNLADEIDATTDLVAKDKKLWDWLKEYNKRREAQGHSLFFPSAWDTVRLSINTSTKLVDRALSEDELEAMIERVGAFKGVIGTTGLSVEIEIDGLTEDEIKAKIDALLNLTGIQKRELLEDALFNRQQRESEAERAFNINRNYQKFLGTDARWGGMVARVVNDAGDTELKIIWEMAEEILKAKIDKEAADIEIEVTAHEAALRARGGLTDAQVEEVKIKRRRLLRRDATFGATLALREIGIANDLPIWNYYYYNDPQRIQTFAPLVGYTHNDKPKIIELLDKGRREMRAVFDYLADQYMDGKILVVQHEPNADVEKNGQPKDFHKESRERARVINEASSVTSLRDVFESRFMQSTSGGIKVVDLISKIGDLGIYDLLWEMGCKDFREFQGFIKRRDEWELRRQSFWNIREWRDPISYAKRLRGAGAALPFLRGGEVKGQGRKPGTLQEPIMGAWKLRDQFFSRETWMNTEIREMAAQRDLGLNFRNEIQKILEADQFKGIKVVDQLDPIALDNLVRIGGELLVTVIDYMDSLRYKMNRAGFAPKNWELDNELIFKAWVEEVLKRSPLMDKAGKILQDAILGGAEKLGSNHMGYAVQGRSRLAVRIYTNVLRTSTYHLLEEADRAVLADTAKEIKQRMDVKRREIAARPLEAEVQARIDNRRNQLRAKGMGERIDRLIARGVIPTAEINSLVSISDERRKELRGQGVQDDEINALINLNIEVQRLAAQYIDERLHKEFVGEWSARFAGI